MSHVPGHPAGYEPPPTLNVGTPLSTNLLSDVAAAEIAAAEPAPTGGGEDGGMPVVYQGTTTYPTFDTPRGYGSQGQGQQDETSDLLTLVEEMEKMSRREQRRLAFLLTLGGFGPSASVEDAAEAAKDMTLGQLVDAYSELLATAAGKYQVGQKVTPERLLKQAIAFRLPGDWDGDFGSVDEVLQEHGIVTPEGKDGEKKEDLSGTFTSTSTDISRDIMDPNDAMSLTRAMLQRELGRDPTKAEFEDFVSTLQHAQRVNPTKTTESTTLTTDADGNVIDRASRSTTQAGITSAGLSDIALRKARANPGWAEWQAVGTYAPALFEALGATVAGR